MAQWAHHSIHTISVNGSILTGATYSMLKMREEVELQIVMGKSPPHMKDSNISVIIALMELEP